MIIFDCDGVLVDSEIISNTINAELMRDAGHTITAADLIRGYIGRPKAEIWAAIARERGLDWPEGLLAKADALLLERIKTELLPVQSIEATLSALSETMAVASSSALPKLRTSLEVCGLIDFFEPRIFSASQVARGKPAPDVFLFAASQCGVSPIECIVVEDSVAGVKAALAANMTVIGFTGGRHTYPGHENDLRRAGAPDVIVHMSQLPETIARLR